MGKGTSFELLPDDEPQKKPVEPSAILPAGELVAAQEKAQIDLQIATAKQYPRSLAAFAKRVVEIATLTQEVAESCWYALPRGGKVIEGPSVRLAEIVAGSYKNLRFGARIVAIDEKHITSQGICHDLENNVAGSIEVKRRITKKNGQRFDEDMIVVTGNAASSIAARNAIFKVVPTAVLKEAYAEIKKVAMGSERTLTERRRAVMIYFANLGVDEPRVLAVIQKPGQTKGVEDITLDDVMVLRGLATAIQEGITDVEQAFPAVKKGGASLKAGKHSMKKPPKKQGAPKKANEPKVKEPEPAQEPEQGKEGEGRDTETSEGKDTHEATSAVPADPSAAPISEEPTDQTPHTPEEPEPEPAPFDRSAAEKEISKALNTAVKKRDNDTLEAVATWLRERGLEPGNWTRADDDVLKALHEKVRDLTTPF